MHHCTLEPLCSRLKKQPKFVILTWKIFLLSSFFSWNLFISPTLWPTEAWRLIDSQFFRKIHFITLCLPELSFPAEKKLPPSLLYTSQLFQAGALVSKLLLILASQGNIFLSVWLFTPSKHKESYFWFCLSHSLSPYIHTLIHVH